MGDTLDNTGKYFAKNLHLIRTHLGLTQEQLAEQLGVTRQQVYRYEHEVTQAPSGLILQQTARLAGVTIEQLITKPLEKGDLSDVGIQ